MEIVLTHSTVGDVSSVYLYGSEVSTKMLPFKKTELDYLLATRARRPDASLVFDRLPHHLYVLNFDADREPSHVQEQLRIQAGKLQATLSQEGETEIFITGMGVLKEELLAFLEGLHMANYRFDKYKSKKDVRLQRVWVDEGLLSQAEIDENHRLWRRIDDCRDWVNEPVMVLNADRFARLLSDKATALADVKCTVYEQRQIEAMKMGGLLAVNRGSDDEARFVVLEYNPENRINSRPVALVGKGIMYDTGGLNIKPDDYMREMKSDMAGAATMATVLFAAAENRLPVHVMAFLPLTDNRPGKNAYAADDILTMYDGTTVEVVNTDAEGRLVLADAIAYSTQFNPELIVDAATLTGAAVRAIGTCGIAAMQQNASNAMKLLTVLGNQVYERLAEFPFWAEYDEKIQSDVADLKNCGDAQAGAITAGKFNAHFAKQYPFVHLDIAGVAFFSKKEKFYGSGASGYGVRLLYAFLQTYEMLYQ